MEVTGKVEMEEEDVADLVGISAVEISDQDKDEREGDKRNMVLQMVEMASGVEQELDLEKVGR